jgi:hypothetical protein
MKTNPKEVLTVKKHANTIQKVGSWAFIVGLLLAIIVGAWPLGTVATSVLILLGLIVGFLNVTSGESNSYLFSSLVLVVISGLGGEQLGHIELIGPMLQSEFSAMMVFIIPGAVVVALKAIYALAETE